MLTALFYGYALLVAVGSTDYREMSREALEVSYTGIHLRSTFMFCHDIYNP